MLRYFDHVFPVRGRHERVGALLVDPVFWTNLRVTFLEVAASLAIGTAMLLLITTPSADSPAGSMYDYFRGNTVGVNPLALLRDSEPVRPSTGNVIACCVALCPPHRGSPGRTARGPAQPGRHRQL